MNKENISKAFNIIQNPKFKSLDKQYVWIKKNLYNIIPEADHFEWRNLKHSVELTVFIRDGLLLCKPSFTRIIK